MNDSFSLNYSHIYLFSIFSIVNSVMCRLSIHIKQKANLTKYLIFLYFTITLKSVNFISNITVLSLLSIYLFYYIFK